MASQQPEAVQPPAKRPLSPEAEAALEEKRARRRQRRTEAKKSRAGSGFAGGKWKDFVPDVIVTCDSASRTRVETFVREEFPAGSDVPAEVIESKQEHRLVFVKTPAAHEFVRRLWRHPLTWARLAATFPVDGRCPLPRGAEALDALKVPAGARVRMSAWPRSLIPEYGPRLSGRGVEFATRDYTHVLFLVSAYKKLHWGLRPADWFTVRGDLGEPTRHQCRDRVLVQSSPVADLLMPGREGPAPEVPAGSTAPAITGDRASKVCRAYWKLNEAFYDKENAAWLRAFRAGGRVPRAVDVGASPGGWTWFLASHGVDVVSVDPGDIAFPCVPFAGAPAAAEEGRVRHAQCLIQDVYPALREQGPFDLLVCDMNEPPEQAASRLLELVARGILGQGSRIVLTAKLFKVGDSQAQDAAELLEAVCEARPRVRHLFHNTRHERTLTAVVGANAAERAVPVLERVRAKMAAERTEALAKKAAKAATKASAAAAAAEAAGQQ